MRRGWLSLYFLVSVVVIGAINPFLRSRHVDEAEFSPVGLAENVFVVKSRSSQCRSCGRALQRIAWLHDSQARAKQHRTFKQHARQSHNGSGYWYGFKLHAQGAQRGRLCAVRLTAANVDDRQLLEPLADWIETSSIVGDRGYISQERARELGQRGLHRYTPNRKKLKKLATPFQVAYLQARHRIEECFEFLKCCFGMIRSTHRAEHTFAIHLLVCLLAYSLYNSLFQ